MKKTARRVADVLLSAWGVAASPLLRTIADHRGGLPGFQRVADRLGFQIRAIHYYEPTYRESDLPAATRVERALPGLDLNEAAQLELLGRCRFADELAAIPVKKARADAFGYDNPMYGLGDAEMLYNLIRLSRPRRIIEVGCGQSTLMARLALAANRRDDPAYDCEQLCIEPHESAWLEGAGVNVLRERVEKVDLAVFDRLEAGDILFIDSSHVIRPWGDVLRAFQEIIPRVKPGVLIQVHDVFTPRDYPETWLREQRRLWNEQYLMESFLTFNDAFEVVCALNWLKHNHWDALTQACPMLATHPAKEPGAFWFRRR